MTEASCRREWVVSRIHARSIGISGKSRRLKNSARTGIVDQTICKVCKEKVE